MSAIRKIVKYELRDIVRGRWMIAYALFFLGTTEALFRFGTGVGSTLLSLLNVVLLLIPLVSIIFGTMYLYDAREFMELLLSQPVNRRQTFAGFYVGMAAPLVAAFLVGAGIPFLFRGLGGTEQAGTLGLLALTGVLLTLIFIGLAFLIAVAFDDKVRGLGLAILAWLGFAIVYDGIVMLLASAFSEYPLERTLIVMITLNPIDLARVLLLLRFDIAALMGYTGAVLDEFFGSAAGMLFAFGALAVWVVVPVVVAMRFFRRKDF